MTASTRFIDQLADVVELACLTGCRTGDEQRALLRVAAHVDRERSKDTTMNPPEIQVVPYLERMADTSRYLEDGDRRIVTPSEIKARKRKAKR